MLISNDRTVLEGRVVPTGCWRWPSPANASVIFFAWVCKHQSRYGWHKPVLPSSFLSIMSPYGFRRQKFLPGCKQRVGLAHSKELLWGRNLWLLPKSQAWVTSGHLGILVTSPFCTPDDCLGRWDLPRLWLLWRNASVRNLNKLQPCNTENV